MEKFTTEVKQFLLNISLNNFEDNYWLYVVNGIELLFKFKGSFTNKKDLLNEYLKARDEALKNTNNRYIEEVSDELWAVLINAYPMPDFWNSTLKDFKEHINFKKYFEMQ